MNKLIGMMVLALAISTAACGEARGPWTQQTLAVEGDGPPEENEMVTMWCLCTATVSDVLLEGIDEYYDIVDSEPVDHDIYFVTYYQWFRAPKHVMDNMTCEAAGQMGTSFGGEIFYADCEDPGRE